MDATRTTTRVLRGPGESMGPPVDLGLRSRFDAGRAAVRPTVTGTVERIVGLSFEVAGLDLPLGATVEVLGGREPLSAEVVGCGSARLTCVPYGDMRGLHVGARVAGSGHGPAVPVGTELLGRVIDALGRPLDDGPPLSGLGTVEIDGTPPHPLRRW